MSSGNSAPTPTSDSRPPLLGTLAGYRLRRATGRMMNDLRAAFAPLGMRPMLFAIMELIDAEPGIIQSSAGNELGIQRANFVPLINDLVARGYVERRVTPTDRRALSLFLTPEGVRIHREATRIVLEHEQRTLLPLSAAERAMLMDLLERVAT